MHGALQRTIACGSCGSDARSHRTRRSRSGPSGSRARDHHKQREKVDLPSWTCSSASLGFRADDLTARAKTGRHPAVLHPFDRIFHLPPCGVLTCHLFAQARTSQYFIAASCLFEPSGSAGSVVSLDAELHSSKTVSSFALCTASVVALP